MSASACLDSRSVLVRCRAQTPSALSLFATRISLSLLERGFGRGTISARRGYGDEVRGIASSLRRSRPRGCARRAARARIFDSLWSGRSTVHREKRVRGVAPDVRREHGDTPGASPGSALLAPRCRRQARAPLADRLRRLAHLCCQQFCGCARRRRLPVSSSYANTPKRRCPR